ncbi:amidase family protein [Mycobacteroides abscessus]|uniref:amidase family protein n=1 Tax=Mycobacteroides abscessus TaxID=36809 RepID=UPI0009C437AE|nr:amidase family protein [Mycobacteroides abscessus]SLF24191.1 amidase, Asp-tRNAAsn/Glu-tRNAGln amidotransferase A subunit [Mycobacteroides abscessus subsp. abscessus]
MDQLGYGLDFSIAALRAKYRSGTLTPSEVATEVTRRVAASAERNIWIALSDRLFADADALQQRSLNSMPLYGIPFALKDNIDVAGIPTTAGCRQFAYVPDESAPIAAKLMEAGALFVGKANMDQFATVR